ncbi:hypothetical protein B0T09DRAFT_321451 [Sordaria sp. MPI-SDFR-AT-0083]|nr:hypothetical protein B0T09DRAFT_321451 [Sordaria sp. MPI-SDFR-AT-0083]
MATTINLTKISTVAAAVLAVVAAAAAAVAAAAACGSLALDPPAGPGEGFGGAERGFGDERGEGCGEGEGAGRGTRGGLFVAAFVVFAAGAAALEAAAVGSGGAALRFPRLRGQYERSPPVFLPPFRPREQRQPGILGPGADGEDTEESVKL